jgi:ribosomal-protein-alanine N-acetyltransferase
MIETARLVIRRILPADAAAMHAVYGDAEAMRWVADGKPLALERCEEWVRVTGRNYAARGYGMFAVRLRDGDEIVGFCGLVHPGGQADAEIKYAFGRAHWGKGYATEVATAVLRYGASVHGLTRIIATAAPENLASHRVLTKAGMSPAKPRHGEDGAVTLVFAWNAPQIPGEPEPRPE